MKLYPADPGRIQVIMRWEMLNYWWVTRPKRKLDSVPEVLATFAEISLNQEWYGQKSTQMGFEDALEEAGLKRVGERRDKGGSGGRTYWAWLESLGLIFRQESTGYIKLTLAGEAIMDGESSVEILRNQVLKYQFPSAFSISRGVNVNRRFVIRPFRFLLKLLMDDRIQYLTQNEIAKIVAVDAENESDRCYERVVEKIINYRAYGDSSLDEDFLIKYKPSRGDVNFDHPYSHLEDLANTMINWLEYTQLAKRDENGKLAVLSDRKLDVDIILNDNSKLIDGPDKHESFQRKYGLDTKHRKDTRNLTATKTITNRIIEEQKIKQAFIRTSILKPITGIDAELIDAIAKETGISKSQVEDVLYKTYPHGAIDAFMTSYFEMAFKGTEEAIEFEKATTEIFEKVFGYNTKHLGQTGSKSAPDVLLISDDEGYQSIIDNKAYSRYSITGDHHNRMVHNYIGKIDTYSPCQYPIGFFSYIAGGFSNSIDRQIQEIHKDTAVNGSGISVTNFIKMVDYQMSGDRQYSHSELRRLFGLNRQIHIDDIDYKSRAEYGQLSAVASTNRTTDSYVIQ